MRDPKSQNVKNLKNRQENPDGEKEFVKTPRNVLFYETYFLDVQLILGETFLRQILKRSCFSPF